MAKQQRIAGLGVNTILALGSGIVLYFVLVTMFPRLATFIRGTSAAAR